MGTFYRLKVDRLIHLNTVVKMYVVVAVDVVLGMDAWDGGCVLHNSSLIHWTYNSNPRDSYDASHVITVSKI